MIYIITVMMFYQDVDKPKWSFYLHNSFTSIETCNNFITDNKVELIISLLNEFNKDGKLRTFEYFCESREPELEV
jgi:hypothetical protein